MVGENQIERLSFLLAKLPGLGPRSARRAVLHMIKHKESYMLPLVEAMQSTSSPIIHCNECGNIDTTNPCAICNDNRRDNSMLCVVETIADLWAIERGKIFKGFYHVLGGTLSASERDPADLNLVKLVERAKSANVIEVILATNATIDGQTTAYYITEMLKNSDVKISRLAYGIPVGGELDYLDEGTLLAALKARQPF
jgi:recombination protein RecR